MKAIMLTIRLWYFYLTYKGIKTVDVRKSLPKNFKGDVYECVSKTNWKKDLMKIPENEREFFKKFVGKVGLKFSLNKVEEIEVINDNLSGYSDDYECGYQTESMCSYELYAKSCLKEEELDNYLKGKIGYAWHIDNLVIFDEPKELRGFVQTKRKNWEEPNVKKAPQSCMYVDID